MILNYEFSEKLRLQKEFRQLLDSAYKFTDRMWLHGYVCGLFRGYAEQVPWIYRDRIRNIYLAFSSRLEQETFPLKNDVKYMLEPLDIAG